MELEVNGLGLASGVPELSLRAWKGPAYFPSLGNPPSHKPLEHLGDQKGKDCFSPSSPLVYCRDPHWGRGMVTWTVRGS